MHGENAALSTAVSARPSDTRQRYRRQVSPSSAAAANEPSSDEVDSLKRQPAKRQTRAALRRAVYAMRWSLAAARKRPRRLLLVLLLLALLVSGIVRSLQRPPLIIPRRHIPAQAYQHLDLSAPISPMERPRRILHVTKEFGPATMGGLGVMLTALATAQAESPLLSIAVALPHYSYLSDRLPRSAFEPFANLSIPVAEPSWYRRLRRRRRTRTYRCPVTRLCWPLASEGGRSDRPSIDIFLLGPSDEKPFSVAFHAKDEGDIYSAYKPLKQEWKDVYFARAAAELVRYLAEVPLEARPSTAAIDVVHLHGATNAMVGYFLRTGSPPSTTDSVAIVYTLHDSLDEVEYSNLVANVQPFLPHSRTSDKQTDAEVLRPLQPYIYRSGTQLFTSALGIDLSDVTTFVSRSIASDIVARRFRFHLEDLVMPSIAAKAARDDFIGVTNALDFSDPSKNPFRSEQLIRAGVAFLETDLTPSDGAVDDAFSSQDEPFTSAKRRARHLLVAALPELFSVDDLHRPWFLFIGRYQYNKGCQFFETLVDLLASSPTSGRLVLLGARNNYPFDELSRLALRYPNHVTLVDDRTPAVSHIQREWGAILRMASDIAFVPSLSEAFGLVAAEALLFGMPVLSTGVGGLREFLDPIPDGDGSSLARTGNSYLFDLFPDRDTAATQGAEQDYSQSAEDVRPSEARLAPARAALRAQVETALRDWSHRQEAAFESEGEIFCRRLVSQALSLRWDRPGGPVEKYTRVYDRAMQKRVV